MNELRTKFWVEALIRRAESGLASIYVIRRGDEDAGAALVKVVLARDDVTLYVPARDESGLRIWTLWRDGEPGEREIDAYCQRRVDDDPDVWIVEIEDRQGRHFLVEPVLDE
jgi:hypothetical protein